MNIKIVDFILSNCPNININEINCNVYKIKNLWNFKIFKFNNTALHESLNSKKYYQVNEIVKLLLNYKGIDINIQNLCGKSPIMIAQKNGNKKVVDLLLSNPNINLNLIDKKRKSLLSLSYDNDELFTMLVKNLVSI